MELPAGYADTLPQIFYKNEFTHSGDYSLVLWNRGTYALPALADTIDTWVRFS